jgi:hypothetical protein
VSNQQSSREQVNVRARQRNASRLSLWLLRSDVGPLVERSLTALWYTAQIGRPVVLPVHAARHRDEFVVLVGNADHKTWWRHFRQSAGVEIWTDGGWRPGLGVVENGDSSLAATAYQLARPGAQLDQDATFVRISRMDRRIRVRRCTGVGWRGCGSGS